MNDETGRITTDFWKAFKENAKQATVIWIGESVLLAFLNALPFLLLLISPMGFLYTLVVWAGFGFSLILYLDNCIMRGIFADLEEASGDP